MNEFFVDTGLEVTSTYDDGSTEIIVLDNTQLTINPLAFSTAGEKTITVTYEGKKATFDVTVLELGGIKLDVEDIAITDEGGFNITEPVTLSRSNNGGNLSETIELMGSEWSDLVWRVEKIDLGNDVKYTLNAGNFNNGTYTLTCEFTKNNKRRLASLKFTVID